MNRQLVVFSDLDATLLDHYNYRFDAANAALEKLKQFNIPLVLNSSKTKLEMQKIRHQLHNQHPYIVENGTALVIPAHYFQNEAEEIVNFSSEYSSILAILERLKAEGFKFRHFSALTAGEVSELTSLSEVDAEMAKDRFGSEPLLWDDSEENLVQFTAHINKNQLKLIKGGRFYHVVGLFDKGRAVEYALRLFEGKYSPNQILSIGLGDSPNDIPMLEAVDIAIVIKSGRTSEMQLTNANTIFSQLEGPAGWNDEMLRLLEQKGT
ncbi:MAG: HAD-IIB family hydrolase [Methylotenera sp.]